MEFSTKAQQLQPQTAAAVLWVCADNAPDTADTLVGALYLKSENSEHNPATASFPLDGQWQERALVRLTADGKLGKLAQQAAKWAARQTALAVDLNALDAAQAAAWLEAFVPALHQSAYRYDALKQKAEPAALENVAFYRENNDIQAALSWAQAVSYGMTLCQDLGNAPGNVCTPHYLAEQAKSAALAEGAQAAVLDAQAIQDMGMGAFWSVAKGSDTGAYFIELRYQGAANPQEAPVVLVGKGITFDSGGISLKPGADMDEMKFDMCGAATVIGTFCAAARLKLPVNLVALVPTCENLPSGGANKPGDVVRSLKGLTIEVLNTDAEGRLILCDALTYAERFQPRAVIDVATLTGACIIALGHAASGVFGNDQQLVDQLLAASRAADDKIWQLPLFEEYRDQLKSNFADLQNIGGRPAGAATAAAFLSHFAENYPWAHLDIAGTAWRSGKEKGATGRTVAVLLHYLRQLAA